MDLAGDALSEVLELLPVFDLVQLRGACVGWARNPGARRQVHLARLAASLVGRIKKAQHYVPVGSRRYDPLEEGEEQDRVQVALTTTTLEESMERELFFLLFGPGAASSDPVEVSFGRPKEILALLPGLPPAVGDVCSNAPVLPACPLRCWAGYADGSLKYDPHASKFTLSVRSRALKLCGYWEKTLDRLTLAEYLGA